MIIALQVILIVLLVVGVCLLLNITLLDIVSIGKQGKNMMQRKSNIKSLVSLYGKPKKKFFVAAEFLSAKEILKETRQEKGYIRLVLACIILAVAGFAVGKYVLNSFIVGLIIAFAGFMTPIWRQKVYRNQYEKFIDMQLENCLSLITTSYIRHNDIIKAVKDNINSFDDAVKFAFQEFVSETAINPNMEDCIRNLQSKFNNSVFKEWCNVLIKAYNNAEVKENLIMVTKKLSTIRIIQDELDVETSSELSSYLILAFSVVGCYPMVWLVNKEWFSVYIETLPGHICVAVSAIVLLFSISKIISLLKPVKFER